jgi:hypothetical protein
VECEAAPGHHGEFLAGLELPEHRFHGALDEARPAFEKMRTYTNHLGLYAEQISRTGQQQGNFPRR